MQIKRKDPSDRIIALVGNPNVGKSTVFNALTGKNQHTGNWPGKTVEVAQGTFFYKGRTYILVDLPGTYSLVCQSEEERVATEFLLSGQADCVVLLADATCLERNLNLSLQTMELTDKSLLCINLMDEANRKGFVLDVCRLEKELGIPVVRTSANTGNGLDALKEKLRNLCDGFLFVHPTKTLQQKTEFWNITCGVQSDQISAVFGKKAKELAKLCIVAKPETKEHLLDRFVLGRWTGRLILLGLLLVIFWLTIQGANIPSSWLEQMFQKIYRFLRSYTEFLPAWLSGLLLDGIFTTVTKVISVMLPPMAIFFPLFTLLEDFGYLPRAAFLMDHSFSRCGSCGKQMLTMSMGFGCHAVGVTSCRIISSKKERLLAVLTNAMVPCNGRFPTLIAVISLCFTANSLVASGILTLCIFESIFATMFGTWLLNRALFRGEPSNFILELPPYRKPQFRKIFTYGIWNRVVYVLGRAILVSAPAGAVIWILQQITIKGLPALSLLAEILNPFGVLLGMSGAILLAFFLSFPANELFLPLLLLIEQNALSGLSLKTGLCIIIFMLLHWPCATACLTIRKETGSWKYVAIAFMLPTILGMVLCFLVGLLP